MGVNERTPGYSMGNCVLFELYLIFVVHISNCIFLKELRELIIPQNSLM